MQTRTLSHFHVQRYSITKITHIVVKNKLSPYLRCLVHLLTHLIIDHNYDEESARKILFMSRRLLPVNGTVISTGRTNSHLRPKHHHRLAFMTPFCYWLLLSSGDIEVNPGSAKFPCGICRCPVRVKFNLTQVVTEPTRCTNDSSLIDHVCLSDASLLQSCLTLPPLIITVYSA